MVFLSSQLQYPHHVSFLKLRFADFFQKFNKHFCWNAAHPPGWRPLETLPTRLGLSVGAEERNVASSSGMVFGSGISSIGPGNSTEKLRTNVAEQSSIGKTQTTNNSNAPLGPFLEMYGHLMRAIEDERGGTVGESAAEEPQDLSLHQLPSGYYYNCCSNFQRQDNNRKVFSSFEGLI